MDEREARRARNERIRRRRRRKRRQKLLKIFAFTFFTALLIFLLILFVYMKIVSSKEAEQTIAGLPWSFGKPLIMLDAGHGGKASGVAFEEAIANIFNLMGFDAKRIGGSGDTDVIVRWKDNEGKNIIAIVDGKSKSSGSVSHSDISDVALDTHKEKIMQSMSQLLDRDLVAILYEIMPVRKVLH